MSTLFNGVTMMRNSLSAMQVSQAALPCSKASLTPQQDLPLDVGKRHQNRTPHALLLETLDTNACRFRLVEQPSAGKPAEVAVARGTEVAQGAKALICSSTHTDGSVQFVLSVRRAQLKLFQNLIARLSTHDLRPAQFSALAIIEQNPGLMQSDLAKALAIEPPQVVPLLNKLESRALAVRIRCKPDKRSYGIYLSKSGGTLLQELKTLAAESDQESTAALTPIEREELLRLLKKIYQT